MTCRRTAMAVLLVAVAACSDPLSVPRDPGPPIQTDQLEYRLVKRTLFLRAHVDFTYRNDGATPIYIQNCLGAYGILLEQLRDGEWKVVWGNVIPACLSPALVIAPGESLTGALAIQAGIPGCGCGSFETPEIDGVYRLVIADAFDALDPNGHATGERLPVDRRASNRFVLRL